MTSKVTILVFVLLGLLLGALFTQNQDLVLMMLPFLAYLGIGILQSPSAGKTRLQATRSLAKNSLAGITSIQVTVTVSNQGAAIDRLTLIDPHQPGMLLTLGQIQQPAALRTGEKALLKYTFRSERGFFSWKTARVIVSDSFDLIESEIELTAAAEVQVLPELKKFRPFPLRPQRTLHSAGSIPARLGGRGTDFWGVREYHPGDPLRHLDWRLTARHPNKFFTKEFEQEEIADIGLFLDARKKVDLQVDGDSLFEHSVRAAASLAEVFLRQGNRISMLIFGEPEVNLYPGYGKVQLNRILSALTRTTPKLDGSLGGLHFSNVHMFSNRSLIFVISPLAPNDWQLFPRLRAYGYQVLLISPDPFDFARGGLSSDRTTGLATRIARVERQLEINKISQLWIPVIDWQVSQPLSPLVRNALRHAHIQRGK